MRLLLISDTYVPARISGALQLRDLAVELVAQGHRVTVLTPSTDLKTTWTTEDLDGVRVLRVRAPRSKDVGLVRRAVAEIVLPLVLLRGLHAARCTVEPWDGVVWYSPTIFLGLAAKRVMRRSGCKGYLIVRDLFPDWAVDAGLMRRGMIYRFFKAIERFQYRVADVIGVQTPANVALVARDAPAGAQIEVLHNWRRDHTHTRAAAAGPIDLGRVQGRTVFVYAGNMGVAQDMGAFLELANRMANRTDIGFLFVGRGTEVARLRRTAARSGLRNVEFMEEIDPARIPALLQQCHVGIVALDPRHTTHNIPGKFVTYVRNGLPVLARVNRGNDLARMIAEAAVGCAVEDASLVPLQKAAERLASDSDARADMATAGRELAARYFTARAAATQVVTALSSRVTSCDTIALPARSSD